MSTIPPSQILLLMAIAVFVLGIISFITGILILALRASGKEVKTLSVQTAKLAQKGIAEDVVGLVGNASSLLDALNQLVRTTAGVGVFLTVLGFLLMSIACALALKIFVTNL